MIWFNILLIYKWKKYDIIYIIEYIITLIYYNNIIYNNIIYLCYIGYYSYIGF